ncbi:hypothetical protein E2P81_ATG09959 [Venturia nashicola]|nr:hypothetical protein E2P81_ATG09959 [Venturia nashicola]
MSARHESTVYHDAEKAAPAYEPAGLGDHLRGRQFSVTSDDVAIVEADQGKLHRKLKGAGLFVISGGAFQTGGPGAVLMGFIIIGIMIYLMNQALAELASCTRSMEVSDFNSKPPNSNPDNVHLEAFTMYICRFIDPSWGFACGWQYGIGWLTVLPFEISAACNIIHYWSSTENITNVAWILPLLFALTVIQFFGVKGYGEVEFVLSIIKITACVGFIILGIIIDCRWHAPWSGFLNGFHGFCTVFVTASFAFGGTELTGLAAAEAEDPRKEVPKASKQVGEGSTSRHSPFVIAIQLAGIKVLPSIFNAVILISVMSVANSCTFASTRTFRHLHNTAWVPRSSPMLTRRPSSCRNRPPTPFRMLGLINLAPSGGNIFNWLLALSGLSSFFIFGSIAVAHIRFRLAWKHQGHTIEELPFKAAFGVWGSYICAVMNFLCLAAQFYVALYPVGDPSGYLDPTTFFQAYLAGPFLIILYIGWKAYSWFARPEERPLYIPIKNIDIYTGMREGQMNTISGPHVDVEQRRASIVEMKGEKPKKTPMQIGKAIFQSIF